MDMIGTRLGLNLEYGLYQIPSERWGSPGQDSLPSLGQCEQLCYIGHMIFRYHMRLGTSLLDLCPSPRKGNFIGDPYKDILIFPSMNFVNNHVPSSCSHSGLLVNLGSSEFKQVTKQVKGESDANVSCQKEEHDYTPY